MNSNNTIVLRRPKPFYRPAPGQLARQVPPSPVVLQNLVGAIEALNQKVDSLALAAHRPAMTTAPPPAAILPLEPIRQETLPAEPAQQSSVPEMRVERSKLLIFFD